MVELQEEGRVEGKVWERHVTDRVLIAHGGPVCQCIRDSGLYICCII